MKPCSCEVCGKPALGRNAWLCPACVRLLPQAHLDRLNAAARELSAAQDQAVADLKRIRRVCA